MEYGYWVTNTVGEKTFFVEGCTCCSMSTGGLHEPHCPYYKRFTQVKGVRYETLVSKHNSMA